MLLEKFSTWTPPLPGGPPRFPTDCFHLPGCPGTRGSCRPFPGVASFDGHPADIHGDKNILQVATIPFLEPAAAFRKPVELDLDQVRGGLGVDSTM